MYEPCGAAACLRCSLGPQAEPLRIEISTRIREPLRTVVALFLLLGFFVWLPNSLRLFSCLFGAFIVCIWWLGWLGWLRRQMGVLWVIWFVVSVSPVELSLKNVPGPPRLVGYPSGLPWGGGGAGEQGVAWRRCFHSRYEPQWMLAW